MITKDSQLLSNQDLFVEDDFVQLHGLSQRIKAELSNTKPLTEDTPTIFPQATVLDELRKGIESFISEDTSESSTKSETKIASVITELVDIVGMLQTLENTSKFLVDDVISSYLVPCMHRDINHTRKELGKLLAPNQSLNKQKIVENILMWSNNEETLQITHQLIQFNKFQYYGKNLSLPELGGQSGTYSELEFGWLVVYDYQNNPLGIVNCSPFSIDYSSDAVVTLKLVSLSELFSIQTHSELNISPEEEIAFLTDLSTFFNPIPHNEGDRNISLNAYFVISEPIRNFNMLPMRTKYYLWQYLCIGLNGPELPDGNELQKLLNGFPNVARFLIQIVEGNPKDLIGFNHEDYKITYPEGLKDVSMAKHELLNLIAEVDAFVVEFAQGLDTPNSDWKTVQKRIWFLRSQLRSITLEANQSLRQTTYDLEYLSVAKFHMATIQALREIVFNVYGVLKGRERKNISFQDDQKDFHPEELRQLQVGYANYPHSSASYYLQLTEWLTRAMYNQRNFSQEEKDKTLLDFYKWWSTREVAQGSEENYGYSSEAAKSYTDAKKLPMILANGLESLIKQGKIPKKYKMLIIGGGPGTGIEEPMLNILHERNPNLDPGLVVNNEMLELPPESLSRKMHHVLAKAPQVPLADNSVDVMLCSGSVFENQVGIVQRIRDFLTSAKLKIGGIFMYETGSTVPLSSINQRWEKVKEFNKIHPTIPTGAISTIPEYKDFWGGDDVVSALLFEHPVFPILAKLAGLKMISPPEDPIEFQQMYEKIQDPERIMNISPENHDPTKMPFWVADKTGKNTRVVYIFEKVVDSDPLLENFVENVLKS